MSGETIKTQLPQKTNELPWRQAVQPYQFADARVSIWQMINSIGPYFVLWMLAYLSLSVSYALTLFFAFGAGLFAVRIFIIFHDCGHGSFFKSKRANDLVGMFTGILTFTPYHAWRHSHAVHHATSGDLDRRGVGDVWTLTYEEYHSRPLWIRLLYRVYRNPFFVFLIAPTLDFVVLQRLPQANSAQKRIEKNSVIITNLILLAVVVIMSLLIGFKAYALVQLPIVALASSIGVWLFYVQHQYENTYWEWHENWDFVAAAFYGSSFYKLPKVLQWFTGNIGFHHIHHLSPRIPNYRLEACYKANPVLQQVEPLTLRTSLKSLFVRVWDENRHKMMGYQPPQPPPQ